MRTTLHACCSWLVICQLSAFLCIGTLLFYEVNFGHNSLPTAKTCGQVELANNSVTNVDHLAVLFTTFKEASNRFRFQSNTIRNWSLMRPFVQPVLFTTNTNSLLSNMAKRFHWHVYRVPRMNALNMPFLKDMFAHVRKIYINSSYHGFANGDILFDDGILRTLKGLRSRLTALPDQLVIGRRTNLVMNHKSSTPVYRYDDLRKFIKTQNATLFVPDAIDYFVMAGYYPWHVVPDVIIGRPGYDNFIVATAISSNISVIDASRSLLAVHQTGRDGNFAGMHNKDKAYNLALLGNFELLKGVVSSAHYCTNFDVTGEFYLEEGTPVWKLLERGKGKSPEFVQKALQMMQSINEPRNIL